MFKRYFIAPSRRLWKNSSTTIINLAGLSIGMAATILIMLWVQNETTYDNYHTDAPRIYRLTNYLTITNNDTWVWEGSPLTFGTMAQKQVPEVETVARIRDASWTPLIFQLNGELFKEKNCAYVDSNWFNMFHYNLISGNLKSFIQNRYSIAITETKAKKYFGNDNPVGKIIQVDSTAYTVEAVLQDNPVNSSFQFDLLMPLNALLANPQEARQTEGWGNFSFLTFIKLHKETNSALTEKKLTDIIQENKKQKTIRTALVPLPNMHFETNLQRSAIVHTDKKTVAIFSILAVLLLLTACINYVNLTTARASLRAKEVSIRKIVGAAKWQLFWQFIIESFIVSLSAMAVTLVLVKCSLPFFNQLTENHFTLSFNTIGIWKILLGSLAFTTLMNGLYPAFLLSSFKPLNVFRGVTLLKLKDTYFRRSLVVIQFSISVILIIGTIVIFKQLQYIQQSNSSYNKAQIINITLPWEIFNKMPKQEQSSFSDVVKHDLLSQNSIETVSVAQSDIINNTSMISGGFDWDGRPKDFNPSVARLSVDADFPKMFNLQLIDGRWFRDHDKADERGYILNETAIKEFNIHKPFIGQRFVNGGDSGNIIGVAKDFSYKSMHDKIGPLVIYNEPYYRTNVFIKVKPGQSASALSAIEKKWKQLVPTRPFEYTFLDETFDKLYRSDSKISILILIFSLIAVLISSLGLFGLAAFTAERRVKEIGIRKVLGASVKNIVTLLSKELVVLVALSIIIAMPIAWTLMNKWLENFAYHISINIWILTTAGFIAITIAIITVSMQAIKAAVANPVKSLRTE